MQRQRHARRRRVAAVLVACVVVAASACGDDDTATRFPCRIAHCAHPPFSRPLVSIEFDDGYVSQYEKALPMVERYGWRPTLFAIAGTPASAMGDPAKFMTKEQLKDWASRAEIGSHSMTHRALPELSPAELADELDTSKQVLEQLIGRPVRLFAAPGCAAAKREFAAARKDYEMARTCEQTYTSPDNFDGFHTWSVLVKSVIDDGQVERILDQAKEVNGWVELVWHEIGPALPGEQYKMPADRLRKQLDMVKRSGIAVVTTQQAIDEELGRT